MSMTLRIEGKDDAALTRIAKAAGISKNEAALRAIREVDHRAGRREQIEAATDDIVERYGPLLDRLGQ